MDRIWQWAWNRYATRYTWAVNVIVFPVPLAVYLPLSFVIVAFEKSGRYGEATVVVLVAVSTGAVKRHLAAPAALGQPYVREER